MGSYGIPASSLPHIRHDSLSKTHPYASPNGRHSHSHSALHGSIDAPGKHPNGDAVSNDGHGNLRSGGFQTRGDRGSRERTAPPPINVSQSRADSGGGKILMTPGTATMPITYQLPRYSEAVSEDAHHRHSHSHSDVDHGHDHDHDHRPDTRVHANAHDHGGSQKSLMTRFLLDRCTSWPLLYAIIVEKDSRRIFYFMVLVRLTLLCPISVYI
jgi:zinc transporter 5/7